MSELRSESELSQLKRALVALKAMRAKLESIEDAQTEPIAIIGMSCRFPGGADDPEAFWRLMRDGVDGISEVPPDRWSLDEYYDPDPDANGKMNTRWGGFLTQIDQFDPQFFGISPREATRMDPQQRLLLEVAWEALESAGQAPDKLTGSLTGVFVAISSADYANRALLLGVPMDAYSGTGGTGSLAPGRLSYMLGLQGPNFAVDTACSSSLVALHSACQSLRLGECRMALVGGVNIILLPEGTIYFSKVRAMSPSGRCKTFDASADGYVRGEGCGVLVLKRLSDALADRDNILAVVRGSAVNHDGRSNGLTAPNGAAQRTVIRKALAFAGIQPSEIDYVEAHGTGTPLGDPIEVEALADVLGEGRGKDHPLTLGSVKTNIGHLEAAAGLAGLIKLVLALGHEEIPPHLHFRKLNPYIAYGDVPISVPLRRTPWPRGERKRIAGVSSFGFSGANAHVILEEAPPGLDEPVEQDRPVHLLTLSAKSKPALKQLAQRFVEGLPDDLPDTFPDAAWTANVGRAHFAHRLAVVAETAAQAGECLTRYAAGDTSHGLFSGEVSQGSRPKAAFVFHGEGFQHDDISRELYESQPVFRRALERCDQLLSAQTGEVLLSSLFEKDHALLPEDFFAIEYALSELWRSWGVEPGAVAGSGVGEYVAACVAGVFSLEDGLKLLVASVGSPNEFEQVLARVAFHKPRIGITGGLARAEELATAHHWRHPQQQPTVDIVAALQIQGFDALVEIGSANISGSIHEGDAESFASSRNGRGQYHQLLDNLAALYVRGVEVDWVRFDAPFSRRKIALPTSPFQRQRYWLEAPERKATPVEVPVTEPESLHPLLGRRLLSAMDDIQFETRLSADSPPFLTDHRIYGTTVVPAAHHLAMMFSAAEKIVRSDSFVLENLSFPEPLVIADDTERLVQIVLSPIRSGDYSIRVMGLPEDGEVWKLHASGVLRSGPVSLIEPLDIGELEPSFAEDVDFAPSLYGGIWSGTLHLGPSFRWIERLWRKDGEILIQTRTLPVESGANSFFHSGLLDSSLFHAIGPLLPASDVPWIPIGIDRIRVSGHPHSMLWSHAQLNSLAEDRQSATANVRLTDEGRMFSVEVENIHLRQAHREALLRATQPARDEALYEVEWRDAPASQESAKHSKNVFLIFSDSGGVGRSLTLALAQQGEIVVEVLQGESFSANGTQWTVNPNQPRDFERALKESERFNLGRGTAVYLWGLDEVGVVAQTGLKGALSLTQAAATNQSNVAPELLLLTRGAQPAGADAAVVSPMQAPLWGLGRTFALENPAQKCVLIDLDPAAGIDDAIAMLLAELGQDGTENQIALRAELRYVPRLVHSTRNPASPSTPLALRADASYLITGGFGALGTLIAQWMAARGARNLILVGRSAPSAEALSAIKQMEMAGARVSAVRGDVANKDEMRTALDSISQDAPLRGIVHAAGILDDGMLLGQSWERFAAVMAPKVQGAWNLHKLSAGMPLDFFVLFSSVASILGPPGQANYAAGNAFLDSLAQYRHGQGLAATCINWGPWADAGMAAGRNGAARRLLALEPIASERGLQLLEKFIQTATVSVAVLPVNWESLAQQADTVQPPILSELIREMRQRVKRPTARAEESADLVRQLEAAPVRKRRPILMAHVRQDAMQLLGWAPGASFNTSQSLLEMGMDSLMATDLRNRLQSALSAHISPTLVFDYPTVEGIVDYLLDSILSPQAHDGKEKQTSNGNGAAKSAMLTEIERLSDDEAAQSIAEEMAAMLGDRGE